MSANTYGISSTAITWVQTESEIAFNDTGGADITCVGLVKADDDPQALDNAIQLLPRFIPISNDGPIGNSTRYFGSVITKPSAKYTEEGVIEVRCLYQTAAVSNEVSATEGESTNSDSDRARRSIVTERAPILTHPVAMEFPVKERRLLSALLNGDIRANPEYTGAGSGITTWEFVTENDQDELKEVDFDDTDVTVDGVTASPKDYALAIAAGVDTWERPTIRHTLTKSRNEPAKNSEYSKVGEVTSTPILAPTISGDGQWFLTGITDDTENGETWTTGYEYIHTGSSGALKIFYKNGTGELL